MKSKQNDLWGIINVKGEVIIPFLYDAIGDFSSSRALVVKNKNCGFTDEKGKIVIPVIYPFQESLLSSALFKNGHVLLKQKTKSILLDSTGSKIFFSGYDEAGIPSEGLVPVKKNKKWGFVDLNGKLKIAGSFDEAAFFENGFAKIKIRKLTGIIDKSGNLIVPASFEELTVRYNYFQSKNHGKFGLISKDGMVILPAEYERLEFLNDKIISAHLGEKVLYINVVSGKTIWKEMD